MIQLKGTSVCSNFNSLVYTQCILARKAFYSTGSLRRKSRLNFTLRWLGSPSSPVPRHPTEVKIWYQGKHWDQAFLASHALILSIFLCGLHCIWFCFWLHIPLRYSQMKCWIPCKFQWGAAFQLWEICIQNKTKYYHWQIDTGKIYGSHPQMKLGILNVALRVNISVCCVC